MSYPKPIASIIVRCFNEERHIGRLLHGVEQQTGCSYEVLVVDSGSTDRTLDIAETFSPRIVHIK
ncbi:MAG: glycosyltransferase, partial [Deltaproteobacteria bacterium]|nr:glycosyltransferase [Deltaproteobacteria bacterium]